MSDEATGLQSNIVLDTTTRFNPKGFNEALSSLEAIDRKMTEMISKPYVINVQLKVDEAGLDRLIDARLNRRGLGGGSGGTGGGGAGPGGGPGTPPPGGAGGGPGAPPPGGPGAGPLGGFRRRGEVVRRSFDQDGQLETTQTQDRRVRGNTLEQQTRRFDHNDIPLGTEDRRTNLERKARVDVQLRTTNANLRDEAQEANPDFQARQARILAQRQHDAQYRQQQREEQQQREAVRNDSAGREGVNHFVGNNLSGFQRGETRTIRNAETGEARQLDTYYRAVKVSTGNIRLDLVEVDRLNHRITERRSLQNTSAARELHRFDSGNADLASYRQDVRDSADARRAAATAERERLRREAQARRDAERAVRDIRGGAATNRFIGENFPDHQLASTRSITNASTGEVRQLDTYYRSIRTSTGGIRLDLVEVDRLNHRITERQSVQGTRAANRLQEINPGSADLASYRRDREEAAQHRRDQQVLDRLRAQDDRQQLGVQNRNARRDFFVRGGEAYGQDLLSRGFQQAPARTISDPHTGNVDQVRQYYQTTRVALGQYQVELHTVNERTQQVTQSTLQGAAAARFMAGNFTVAAERVALWAISTALIYTAIQGVQRFGQEIVSLEAKTVFLARVGSNLARESNGSEAAFSKRLAAAERLTGGIVRLTAAIGGNAAEAQDAAAIFLRAGKSEEDTLISVKAALLASRIAELGVKEAAELLSSAMLQFGIEAKNLLPTLDTLNTLSNRYRVTTNDLLQAISRAGGVIKESGGSLTQFSALVAVVSQRTARSGAEIGNALKTVQSRIDSLDVKKTLFERLGISTVNFDGEAKGLNQTLLELQSRLSTVSSSEERELTTMIAGTRQRNILIAAIREAEGAYVAANRALLESGSATTEFSERSHTLEAALERLSGSFTLISNNARGPVSEIARSLVNLTNTAIQLLGSFNGYPLISVVMVGAFLAMSFVVRGLTTALAAVQIQTRLGTFAFNNITGSLLAMSNAATGATATTLTLRSALAGVSATATGVAASLFTAGNGITLLIALGASLAGAYSEVYTLQAALSQTSVEKIDAEISKQEKKREAILDTVKAVSTLIDEEERARSQGKTKQADAIRQRAQKILSSIPENSYHLTGNTAADRKGLAESAGSFEDKAVAEQKVKQDEKVALLKKQREELVAEQHRYSFAANFTQINRVGVVDNSAGLRDKDRYTFKRVGHELLSIVTGGNSAVETAKFALQEMNHELNLTSEALKKAEEEQEKLAEKVKHGAQSATDFNKSWFVMRDLIKSRDAAKPLDAVVTSSNDRAGISNIRDLEEQMHSLNEAISTGTKELHIQQDALGASKEQAAIFQHNKDAVVSYFDEARSAYLRFVDAVKKDNVFVTTQLAKSGKFNVSYNKIATEHQLGLQDDIHPTQVRSAVIDSEQRTIGKNLENLRDAAEKERIRYNSLSAHSGSDLGEKPSIELLESGNRIDSIKKEAKENLIRLSDLEHEKALNLLETEKEIAVARKKSADEALRALGTLSTEDKLRVAAQAAYFKRNPGKQISAKEQFLADGKGVGLAQQLFNGRLERFSLANPFAKALGEGGFGSTVELDNAQKDATERRAGRTDQQIAEEAQVRSSKLAAQANTLDRGLTGEEAKNQTAKGAAGLAAAGANNVVPTTTDRPDDPKFKIDLKTGQFDFGPVTEVLTNTLNTVVGAAVAREIEVIEDFYKKQTALVNRVAKKAP